MRIRVLTSAWWGPPKKFDREIKDRRVSWLELFYDLVYVIAIARITHHLSEHISLYSFLEFIAMFMLIYWGWLNGSLYYDLHGNLGLRTRLMTLWQMMIVSALAITIDHSSAGSYFNTTIVLMIMQFFITYLWWSVGFYDKEHRRYNKPYSVLYIIAFAFMGLSLFLSKEWLMFIVPIVIICNYAPPFISSRLLRHDALNLNLSSSMSERLGLFTIIIFGEAVLGVVNGISDVHITDVSTWVKFALGITIVFSLWWIFFTMASNRDAKKGFLNATLLELAYIPALVSLGMIAACFSSLFNPHDSVQTLQKIIGYAMPIFLISVNLMMGLLETPDTFRKIVKTVRKSLFISAIIFLLTNFILVNLDSMYYLAVVLVLLVMEILFLNIIYFTTNPGIKADLE